MSEVLLKQSCAVFCCEYAVLMHFLRLLKLISLERHIKTVVELGRWFTRRLRCKCHAFGKAK